MTQWALVFLMCQRLCMPQHVELFSTKVECVAKLPKDESWIARQQYQCVPAVKGEAK